MAFDGDNHGEAAVFWESGWEKVGLAFDDTRLHVDSIMLTAQQARDLAADLEYGAYLIDGDVEYR